MKKRLIIYGFSLLAFVLFGTGCKKYLDINQDPNAAAEPPIAGLLANTTYLTAENVFQISDWTSYYVQYLASPNVSGTSDTYQQSDPSGTWGDLYNVLTDLHDMRRFAAQKGLIAYIGVADILTACNLSMGINLWGNMPYSEAFQGVDNLSPKFDDQKVLYDSCLMLLDKGIAALQQPGADGELDKASDFIHAGSTTAWIKTAYSLEARLLNQVSGTPQYDPAKVLAALAKGDSSNDDDAQVTQFSVRNPWAQVAINNRNLLLDGWLSAYFVDATNGKTYGVFDPRLARITDTTMFLDYRGTPNGAGYQGTSNTVHAQCYLDEGKWYSSTNSPLQIITNAECRFIEAEAAFRAGDKPRAYDAYIAGITASMNKIGVGKDSMDAYLKNSAVAVGAGGLTLQLIMKEKYVACFLSPVTWVDMRRFNYAYMDFALPQHASLGSSFIRRMDYPQTEISRNGKNVPDIKRTDHLWWDQ
ncbi:MAG TPA: SusD/RagB family nutrient-binding outer membrane lipoprotein [Chitinophagaceae bacterium]|nr:SusD/RagB family nutrient-binding outer membrane lipoprotein [Chitinophagaceae bacterium]